MSRNRNMLFMLVKLSRLMKGFDILNVPRIMVKIKGFYIESSKNKIKKDKKVGDDIINDHNKIQDLLLISYTLKITKLVIIILNFSYLFGMFWYIMIKLVEDTGGYYYENPVDAAADGNDRTFIVYYNLQG